MAPIISPIKRGDATICKHPIASVMNSKTRKIPPSDFCMSFFSFVNVNWFDFMVTANVRQQQEVVNFKN